MAIPVKIDLCPHTRGDKWEGISVIGPVLINGAQPAESLSRVRMQLQLKGTSTRFVLDTEAGEETDAPIVIDDATTWEVSIPAVQDFVQVAGFWEWDLEFYTGADTSPVTYYEGTLKVKQDV